MEFWRRTMTKSKGTMWTTVQLLSKKMINCSNCFLYNTSDTKVLSVLKQLDEVCLWRSKESIPVVRNLILSVFTVYCFNSAEISKPLQGAKFVLWVKPRTNLVSGSLDQVWTQPVRPRSVCPWGDDVKLWSNTTNSLWSFILMKINSTRNGNHLKSTTSQHLQYVACVSGLNSTSSLWNFTKPLFLHFFKSVWRTPFIHWDHKQDLGFENQRVEENFARFSAMKQF